ncbi:MAG: sulfotransferase family protein [Acidimicrobiia bacterium]
MAPKPPEVIGRATAPAGARKPFTTARLKRQVLRARLALRKPTDHLRMLPDFLIIGTQRGGTSSLFKYLGRHPCVAPSLRKEVEYFSSGFAYGEQWYRSHFPFRLRGEYARRVRGRDLLAFEASPYYLFHPHAAARTAKLLPEAKIIVLLREPVSRAVSHYHHNVRLGLEPLPFEEAIWLEPVRLAGEEERMLEDPLYDSRPHRRFSYAARGRYADQLATWMAHFPRDQILMIQSEDFFSRPAQVYAEVLGLLGLPAWEPPEFRNYSYRKGRKTATPAIRESGRARLAEQFAPYNARLYALLGRDLGWEAGKAGGVE